MEEDFWFPDDVWQEEWDEEKRQLEVERRKACYWRVRWKGREEILQGNRYEILMFEDWIIYSQKINPEIILLEKVPFGARISSLSEKICQILSQEGAVYDWRQRVWRKRRNRLY